MLASQRPDGASRSDWACDLPETDGLGPHPVRLAEMTPYYSPWRAHPLCALALVLALLALASATLVRAGQLRTHLNSLALNFVAPFLSAACCLSFSPVLLYTLPSLAYYLSSIASFCFFQFHSLIPFNTVATPLSHRLLFATSHSTEPFICTDHILEAGP